MPQEHRIQFRVDLDLLVSKLADLADFVIAAGDDAAQALLDVDRSLAVDVIERRWRVDFMAEELDAKTSELLTLQSPVASDLRLLVSVLRASAALRRMGDLAIHIAEIVVRRSPETPVPTEIRPIVVALAQAVQRVTGLAAEAVREGRDPSADIRRLDDEVDARHRDLLEAITVRNSNLHPGATVDLTLLGRYFERIGDQAVNASAWRRDPVRHAKVS
jgi:phosphate transport system protein